MSAIDDFKRQYREGGIVQKLIFWNIGIFILMFIIEKLLSNVFVEVFSYVALSKEGIGGLWKIWTYITYAFLHANIWHLILNMIVLNFIGQLFSTYFNQKQFLTVYLFGAIGGAIFFVLSSFVLPVGHTLVGASAAVMAPMIGLAYYSPNMEIRLALIGRVKMWHIAICIVIIDLFQLSSANVGGHIAHLGGALMGIIYVVQLKKGNDLSCIFDSLVNLSRKSKSTSFKKVYVNKEKEDKRAGHLNNDEKDRQKQIDAILDKISKSGYDSLTAAEKEFLFKVGKE
ncbi:MAG: rhomboid family intramembrane serine protease [Flavobacteriaceae bacterium]|jgi:membrane associated rhomboid family serine protease|nr:rhomboid family intramembrane serine protease [Flavobacteriaceae bacterium]